MAEPRTKGQPPKNGQNACPHFIAYVVYIDNHGIYKWQNLGRRDNLRKMDKMLAPTVSIIRRFHCIGLEVLTKFKASVYKGGHGEPRLMSASILRNFHQASSLWPVYWHRITTEGGGQHLVHKGPGFGKSSQTVVTNAANMSGKWQVQIYMALACSWEVIFDVYTAYTIF